MEKQFNFVYVTTNLTNGKMYVGDHSCENLEKDSYLGSGLLLTKAINKYGKTNFKREILEFCESKKCAFNSQERWINEFNSLSPNGYNISPKGGSQCSGGFSAETIEKLRIASLVWHTNVGFSDETKEKMSISRTGLKDSQETIDKKRASQTGVPKGPTSTDTKEKLRKARKGKPSNHLGKKHSPETIEIMRASRLGKPRGPYKKSSYIKFESHDTIVEK